ncbi:MAG: bifunctional enoyl-CoA hydratase/phosphate acetyltransferase [Spirochaetales bacterium]|nr:MAG: bifunctional enoyl-CoA hydratase/phosphate acetyltransferase [Spirochaetales bacterium]
MRSFSELEEQAKTQQPKRVVLAMAEESDALSAILHAAAQGIVQPVLVGEIPVIRQIAEQLSVDISAYPQIQAYGETECAEKSMELISSGEADLLMKGRLSTAVVVKVVLNKKYGLRGEGLLSHVAITEIPEFYHKLLLMTDAGLNIAPSLTEKISMVNNAVITAHKLGIPVPKVAIIGALEKVNSDMPVTIDAALLSKMADRGQIKECIIDGPFALDNAISKKSCEVKGIKTVVGGDADILIMPDIEAANVFYKTIAYLTSCKIAGVIMGARVPVILTSRSDSDSIKYHSILLGVALV